MARVQASFSPLGVALLVCFVPLAILALVFDEQAKGFAADAWFDTLSAGLAIVGVALALFEERNERTAQVAWRQRLRSCRLWASAALLATGTFAAIVSAAVESNGSGWHALFLLICIVAAGVLAAEAE